MKKNLKPLGDRVLVKPKEKGEETTASGLILSDISKRGTYVFGTAILVGRGVYTQNGKLIPMEVKVGDQIMYRYDMGGDTVKIDDVEYLLFREHDLFMVESKISDDELISKAYKNHKILERPQVRTIVEGKPPKPPKPPKARKLVEGQQPKPPPNK